MQNRSGPNETWQIGYFSKPLPVFKSIIFKRKLYLTKFQVLIFTVTVVWHHLIRVPFSNAGKIAQRHFAHPVHCILWLAIEGWFCSIDWVTGFVIKTLLSSNWRKDTWKGISQIVKLTLGVLEHNTLQIWVAEVHNNCQDYVNTVIMANSHVKSISLVLFIEIN